MNEINDGKIYANSDKSLFLTIAQDNLSAYLTIEDNGTMIDEKEISSLISSVGIKNGLEKAVDYNQKHEIVKEIGKPFLIALASTKKDKAEISYLIDLESCIDIDKNYDMDELAQFEKVKKDQVLAEVSATNTQDSGTDIFGNEVSVNKNSLINIDDLLGNNVHFSEETNQILASNAGYPYINYENKIAVKSTFLSQDIHDTTKQIYGNTTIEGIITSSNLEIFGDLWVKGNIRNCNDKGIIVHGDVILDFIEDSRIFVSGKITINNNARNSVIYAGGLIKAEENSSISGGLLQSGEKMELFTVGSPLNLLTEIEIAIAPFLKEQNRILRNKLDQARKETELDETLITSFVEKEKELQEKFSNEIEKLTDSIPRIINIKGTVYPNTNIRILKNITEISEEKNNIEISVSESGMEINEVDKV